MSVETPPKTPTQRKFDDPISKVTSIFDAIKNGGNTSFDQMRVLAEVATTAIPEELRSGTLLALNQGLDVLEQLSLDNPTLSEPIRFAGGMLMIGTLQVGTFPAGDQIARERRMIEPILLKNNAKAAAVERAKTLAAELWQADAAQEVRLGDMAEQVYRALAAEGFTEALPGTAERIKEWIRPIAPDYARKGGRRRKTP